MRRDARLLLIALPAVAALLAAGPTSSHAAGRSPDRTFVPVATYEVPGSGDAVAEILAGTPDGRTLLYTDSADQELRLVDLTRPHRPVQRAAVALEGEPTSVAVTRNAATPSWSSTPPRTSPSRPATSPSSTSSASPS